MHQTTLATSITWPVVGNGEPVAHVDDTTDTRDPGGDEVLRLHADEWCRAGDEVRANLAADRRADREHVVPDEAHAPKQEIARDERLDAEGDRRRLLAGEPGRVVLHDFHGDVGARIADADHEHGTICELRRALYSSECSWTMRGSSLACERRRPRLLEVGHRDHHVVGGERLVAGGDAESVAVARQPVDAGARADGEIEPLRVALEIVGHLVLGDEGAAAGRESASRAGRSSARA